MTEKSRTKSGSKGKQPLKAIELRLVSELMKNSRRSDRELARALGVSQPTVSRMISRLEKEGIIKEYTMIPDFKKLGYNILGFARAFPSGSWRRDKLPTSEPISHSPASIETWERKEE